MSAEHENDCGHSEVIHLVMKLAHEITRASMIAIQPMIDRREIRVDEAGIMTAETIFGTALETGIRAALIDPIGAQILLDQFDKESHIGNTDLDEANQVLAQDARSLLEAAARL